MPRRNGAYFGCVRRMSPSRLKSVTPGQFRAIWRARKSLSRTSVATIPTYWIRRRESVARRAERESSSEAVESAETEGIASRCLAESLREMSRVRAPEPDDFVSLSGCRSLSFS